MSFDGAFTHAMAAELTKELVGGRISKINQPYPNEVIMVVRTNHHNYPLLLSANPTYSRVQITQVPYVNPPVPTPFTMTLRKYLQSGHLTRIQQMTNDRVLRFHIWSRNELGDLQHLILIDEIMGRNSNIILVDASDMTIIDASRRISKNKDRYRQILPGFKYVQPPKQTSLNPFTFDQYDQLKVLMDKYPNQNVLAKHLQHFIQGLGRSTARDLAWWLHQPGDLKSQFQKFFNYFNHPEPVLVKNAKGKTSFSVYPFRHQEVIKKFPDLSQLLDYYYQTRAQRDRVREKGAVLIKVARNELKKNQRKQKKLKKTYYSSKHANEYKHKGEILTTYMYKVKTGMSNVKLPDFYHPGKTVDIKLSYDRTPSENAQWYFKQYRKKQHAGVYAKQQTKEAKVNVNYFQNILDQIQLSKPSDLDDIKLELQQEGYLKDHQNNQKGHSKKRRHKVSKPERFISDDGTPIYVGKNNLQNDHLTKSADKRDTWMHTKQIHGSHVIVQSIKPSQKTLTQAALLAAYFSKGRESSNVPVDYTLVKHVKKPNGGKPGFVIYRHQHTLFVTPKASVIKHLRQNK
ncbi:NFACT RNA binding domain-containing protein [Acetilactobacillus jinshanensis]|uniref:Rqc2 homolog RqcH n=1 Tax=Acetilactobacillus jinshanensis TaxID=1720083 RepID=A0A4P6ZLH7_9LACO|nr:NFACT RNA binding domain-containing protein [Acetilactobacillus jinshanensis]QBP18538.1 fibronectin/fibrinogen-binding protein [Acetilactobacillus jinshanensis]URL61412.1 fibronectin/fibrinogen-binding protein [uncultured bacterium]